MIPFNPAIGVPVALALRIGVVAITLLATRRIVAARYVAFLGSTIASVVIGMTLVTGPVTRNMEIPLRRTYEAAPEPRVVVAVGACGCSGGIFGEGTYSVVGGVDRVVPVDVYIPGCPPRPQAILNGLLVAMGVREARVGQ